MSTISPEEPYVRMQNYLRPGEQLLWAGRPDPGFRIGAGDVFIFCFAIIWTSFSVIWEASVIAAGDAPLMALFGIPFVLVGLNLLFVKPFRAHQQKKQIRYAVTDQRAIAIHGTAKRVDLPLANSVMDVSRSSDNRLATVALTIGPDSRRSDLVMVDVPDPDRLLAALDRARTPR